MHFFKRASSDNLVYKGSICGKNDAGSLFSFVCFGEVEEEGGANGQIKKNYTCYIKNDCRFEIYDKFLFRKGHNKKIIKN